MNVIKLNSLIVIYIIGQIGNINKRKKFFKFKFLILFKLNKKRMFLSYL